MKWLFCWVGIVLSFISILNLALYTVVEPMLGIGESIVLILIGLLLIYIGKEYFPQWLAYLFSDSDSDGG